MTGSIDALLDATGSISGTVTSDGVAGIPSVYAAVYEADGNGGWTNAGGEFTDSSGAFTVAGLRPGVYRLQFGATGSYLSECWDDTATLSAATDITVLAGQDAGGKDAVLVTAGHVTGTVTSDGVSPIEGLDVVAYADNGSSGWMVCGSTTTAVDGTYDIGGLSGGSYRLWFSDPSDTFIPQFYGGASTFESASPVPVSAGSTASGYDVVLQRAGAISGAVRSDASAPIAGANVAVWASDGAGGWDWSSSAITGPDGTYEAPGLRPGIYRVGFSHGDYLTEYWNDAADVASAQNVVVAGGATEAGVNATLAVSASISGTVTSDGSTGIESVYVAVYRSGVWAGNAYTGADGTYAVTGLRPGSYHVEFSAGAVGYTSEWYSDARWRSGAETITVAAGESVSGIDAILAENGFIAGTVTSDGTTGLPGIYVSVVGPRWAGRLDRGAELLHRRLRRVSHAGPCSGGVPSPIRR